MTRAEARAQLLQIARVVSLADDPDPAMGVIKRAGALRRPGLVATLLLEGAQSFLRKVAA